MEDVRKNAEAEFERLKRDFPQWPENDARRWALGRFPTMLFVPVLGLYLRRAYMDDAAWWEQYAQGSGQALLKSGRPAFDQHLKGKLILDLVGNVEHPFRIILKRLEPTHKSNSFASIYKNLLRSTKPLLHSIPPEWSEALDLLRHMRNSVHNSWVYFPESEQNVSVTFKNKTYALRYGHQIDFVSWDFLKELSLDIVRIMVAVVRDANVVSIPELPDPGAGEVWRG